ncbi:hypothetical protein PQX77_005633 [Marasmius sp. AFHP31]|nr:hypothetical protein PQX77_005633 [Marasmius sp. AFHP31]
MFNNSNSVSVSGGTFSVVHGNQVNYQVELPPNQPRFRSGERWKKSIYREYERIRTGDLKLIRTIGETEVLPAVSACESDNAVTTKRVFQSACIVIGTQETRPSLSIKYTGRDAKKVFKADLLQFSRIKSSMFPQLRSFNDSDIPMVVFHDELIPAKQVVDGTHNWFEVTCYLWAQGTMARSNLLASTDSISLDPMIFQYPNSSQLWIRPQTGQICLGPAGPRFRGGFPLGDTVPRDSLDPKLPLVPLSMYNNLTFLDPVVKNTPSQFLLDRLSNQCSSTLSVSIADYDCHYHVLLSSCRQPVARFTGIFWSFDFHGSYFYRHHKKLYQVESQRITMEDGRIRLTISNHHIPKLSFWFDTGRPTSYLCSLWLSQAAHVFNVLRTPREEWEDYTLLDGDNLRLRLYPNVDHTDTPFECYLFVLPPPQLPDTSPDLAAWRRAPAESLYYWSLDPTGDSRMPKVQRTALGLPSFHQTIKRPQPVCWKAEVYDLARQWQEAQGFDPTTTDFARSMGYPIIEFLPQEDNRFENCADDNEVSMLVDSKNESELERMDVDECFEIGSSSQGALFPRGQCEESSSMDVDMEDCTDLMANLRVGASLMDE